jgi:hypothetical protein
MEINQITETIIGAAIEVHRHLGPGLLESAYQTCLAKEMSLRGLSFEREKPLPIAYKGIQLDCGYRLDFLVDGVQGGFVNQLQHPRAQKRYQTYGPIIFKSL